MTCEARQSGKEKKKEKGKGEGARVRLLRGSIWAGLGRSVQRGCG
jgi:hypothetical protein